MASSPVVPQRPVRSQNPPQSPPDAAATTPQVPPRPTRPSDRSVSRDRENHVRSPLNDSPFIYKMPSREAAPSGTGRPPSVNSLPLIGQEGIEYASLEYGNKVLVDGAAAPNETRNVAGDLPLHAPKASVPAQTTTTKITSVGHGHSDSVSSRRLSTEIDDPESLRRPPSARTHGYHRPPSRATSSRAESIHGDDDHGIPEIGVQVPLLHMAGDVQAPSPAPFPSDRPRRRSAHDLVPPGSYGLHGHGSGPMDKFDMDWYQKHPEELAREGHGAYGPGMASVRGEYVMSSEELNKMVRETGSRGHIVTTTSLPPEDYGYSAGPEEVLSRSRSETPLHRIKSRSSSVHADSPLRQNFSHEERGLESETEDEQHLRPLSRPQSKSNWFHSQDDLHRQLHGEEVYEGYTTPILAEDEVAKNPLGGFLTPAVTSEDAHSRELLQSHIDYEAAQRSPRSRSASRPSSRPNSVHGHSGLSRFISHEHVDPSHAHLTGVEEYEPLFKDNDGKIKRVVTAKERARKLELSRFPSRDIWEDTPDSLRLETEVTTPDLQTDEKKAYFGAPEGEHPQRPTLTDSQKRSFLDDAHAKPGELEAAALHGVRPPSHRFPSRDIWEDTPDSSYLVTTVNPEEEEESTVVVTQPVIPQRPTKAQPSVPPRPSRVKPVDPSDAASSTSPEKKAAPSIPDRPKPHVPPRPQRTSAEEGSAQPPVKAKPPVPSSSSSKFSNIKAGFMNDLNSRLKLGPQAPQKPKEEEPEQEKVPLADARKGRAKGPSRRTPPTAAAAPAPAPQIATGWSISKPWTVWSIAEDKELEIGEEAEDAAEKSPELPASAAADKTAEEEEAPVVSPLATNTAGERLQRPDAVPSISSGALAHGSSAEMDARARSEDLAAQEALKAHMASTIGSQSDVPEPIVDQPIIAAAPPQLVKESSSNFSDEMKTAAGISKLSKSTAPLETLEGGDSPAMVASAPAEAPFKLEDGEGVALSRQLYEPPADGGRPAEEKSEAEGGLAGQ